MHYLADAFAKVRAARLNSLGSGEKQSYFTCSLMKHSCHSESKQFHDAAMSQRLQRQELHAMVSLLEMGDKELRSHFT